MFCTVRVPFAETKATAKDLNPKPLNLMLLHRYIHHLAARHLKVPAIIILLVEYPGELKVNLSKYIVIIYGL